MKLTRILILALLITLLLFNSALAQEPGGSSPQPQNPGTPTAIPIEYNTLYATAYTDLWKINPYTGSFTKIGPIGYQGTDIAFDGKNLFGINFSQLLGIDPTTGQGYVIGNIGFTNVNALAIALDGTMYAGTTSGDLLRIDKTTGAGAKIGNFGSGLYSSGDIAVRYDGKAFAAVVRSGYSKDWLVQIDLGSGKATPIGEIGESAVYGLDFKDWSLYGVTSGGYLLEIDPSTGKSSRIGSTAANFWGLSTSGPALTGNITSPTDNSSFGPASIPITATASYPGGKSVNQVEFYVFYDGFWRSLGNDTSSPYTNSWQTPNNLRSQQTLLRIDVVGTDLQNQIQRAPYAGGVRRVNFLQSMSSGIVERWVATRAYLNQRSLNSDSLGDSKCNVSSIAMILAMEGVINGDYLTMANKAEEMWPEVWPGPSVDKVYNALKARLSTAQKFGPISKPDGWMILKSYINGGHGVILDSRPGAVTEWGHYVVAVGYQEIGSEHLVIAYDPFGEWRGTYQSYFYNSRDPASHVGKWVYYDFEDFVGSEVYLIAPTAPACTVLPPEPPVCSGPGEGQAGTPAELTPPDQTSDEVRLAGYFDGQALVSLTQFLPFVNR